MMTWDESNFAEIDYILLVGISKEQVKLSEWEEQNGIKTEKRRVPIYWLNDMDRTPKKLNEPPKCG